MKNRECKKAQATKIMLKHLFRTNVLIRYTFRFYRKRGFPMSSHIPVLKGKTNTLINGNPMMIDSKTPEEFEKSLKSIGFEEIDIKGSNQDLLLSYLKCVNPGFKKSSKNLRKLEQKLSAKNIDDVSKLQHFFNYLLEEGELEIRRLETMNSDTLRGKYSSFDYQDAMDRPIESAEQLEENIILGMVRSPANNEEVYLTNVDFIYQILTDLNNGEDTHSLSIEQLVQAFELAKLVPSDGRRKRGIFLAGNLIYKTGKVRMDPVNESFYIDSLVNYGLFKKAYQLFESNKASVNQRWWYEMGMMIALRANYLQKFDKLLAYVDAKFNEAPYISPKVLKLAIKKKLYLRDFNTANKLTSRFLEMIQTYGFKQNDESASVSQTMITFQSDDRVEKFLNEKEISTNTDFIHIIEYHLFKKNNDTAIQLLAQYLEVTGIDSHNYYSLIVQMKLYLLQDFNYLKETLKPRLSTDCARQCLSNLETEFNRVIEQNDMNLSKYKELLFADIPSLAGNSALRNVVEEFVLSGSTDCPPSEAKMISSKKIHCVLKLLLASNKEHEAIKLLSKMEEHLENDKGLKIADKYQVKTDGNAHHYALFIEYYTVLAVKASKKRLKVYEEKVSDMMKKMNELNIPINAVFLTKVLIFYRETNNFNEAFKLINGILKAKETKDTEAEINRTSLYNRRDITKPLYVEVWKVYSKYYKIFTKELERMDKKSNYIGWKSVTDTIIQNTTVHPIFSTRMLFSTMVNEDNILPDSHLYYIILISFIRKRDWCAIPAILTSMSAIHGLEIPEKIVNYFMKGLEREFILLNRRLEESQGLTHEQSRLKSKKILSEYKRNGELITPISHQPDTLQKLLQQMQFLLQHIGGESYSSQEIRKASYDMGVVVD